MARLDLYRHDAQQHPPDQRRDPRQLIGVHSTRSVRVASSGRILADGIASPVAAVAGVAKLPAQIRLRGAAMEYREISEDYSVSGQIQAEDIAAIKAAGFKSVICNRPDDEQPGQPSADSIEVGGRGRRPRLPLHPGHQRPDHRRECRGPGRGARRAGRPGVRLLPLRRALHQSVWADPAVEGLISLGADLQ